MPDPLVPDWTTFMTRCQAHLKKAEDAFLLRDWQAGIDAMGEAQTNINRCVEWMLKREIMEGIK